MIKWLNIIVILLGIAVAIHLKNQKKGLTPQEEIEYEVSRQAEIENKIKAEKENIERMKKKWHDEGKTEAEIVELFRAKWQSEGHPDYEIRELIKIHLTQK